MLSDAGRNPPCTLRSTSIAASRDDRRVPNYRPRPNRASLDEERPRRSERTTETSEGGAADRLLSCRLWIDRVNAMDRRARPLRSRQGDSDEDGGRRTWAEMDSKSISACRSTQRPSRRQTGRLRRASEPQREKTNPVIAGSVCTHLLPWGCHTIMELVLAALPVETTGALLRTGAMAEIAAILFCSCGYAGTSGADGLLFISRLLRRQIILSKCFLGWAVWRWRCTSLELEVLATALGKT